LRHEARNAEEGMKVSKLMTKDLITCRPADTLDFAAQQMWAYDIGALPVVDGHGRIVGIVTDRDALLAAFMHGEPLTAISVDSTMSAEPFTCSPDDELVAVEAEMRRRQIRRVPVVDGDGRPIGMVSMDDLARVSMRSAEVTATEVAATLAAVSAPHLIGGRP
jgi:CBS domain-containing protein